jgi:uncharacterized protein YbdZ (MbtH family)
MAFGGGFKDDYGAEVVMRVTCQRCGTQIFRKQIGYCNVNAAIENRHDMFDQFEPIPEGWRIKHDLGGWCCSKCIEDYYSIIKKFKSIT